MTRRVAVVENITKANDRLAAVNRNLLAAHRLPSFNLLSSPGAGKTSLVERTVTELAGRCRIGVIEGDMTGSLDAERAEAVGARAVQINTGGACHLDAGMVTDALDQLPLGELDLVIVENVGNLICPASFDLGTTRRVVIASVPEGDDKPLKYPTMYRGVDLLVLNKIDLLPYVRFDVDRFVNAVAALNENLTVMRMSCTTGEGFGAWLDWVAALVAAHREPR